MTKSFDHLLREALKAPVPPDECLDAGVLAAWFEGTLARGERAAAEAHAAACPRCQAALAAMIRIEPLEPPIESRPWWRSPAFGWLVPLTVAAAALVIFIRPNWHRTPPDVAVLQAPEVAPPVGQPAPQQSPGPVAAEPVAPPATPPPARQSRPLDRARQEGLAKRQDQANAEALASPKVPSLSADAALLKDRAGVPVDDSRRQRAASAAAATPPPPTVRAHPSGVTAAPPAPAAASPVRPVEGRSAGAPVMAEKSLAESVMLRSVAAAGQREIVIQSPGGASRWWITAPGSVQRSNDAGTTWETQATGVSAVITNGHAPSDSVCWLVGKGGVVLVSPEGRTWRRVQFPPAVDLISVKAADATTATVVTVEGRTFSTTDGGKSWK